MYHSHIEPDNGAHSLLIEWESAGGEMLREEKLFFSESSAREYAREHERKFILDWLKRFVGHARVLSEVGNKTFYNTQNKWNSLERMIAYESVAHHDSLSALCFNLLNYEQSLRSILPAPTNISYLKQKEKLERILGECRRIRRTQLKQIA